MHKSNCKICGKEREYKYKSWIQPYCSYTCARKSKPAKQATINCIVCGNIKNIKAVELSQRTGKYCSQKCAGKIHAKQGSYVLINCAQCGKEIRKRHDLVKKSNYCSKKCTGESRQVIGAKWKDKDQIKIYMKNYAKAYAIKNPHIITMRVAKRRAQKRLATPAWASESDIKFVYKLAKMAYIIHGVKYEVDHIVPLISNEVCGLHVYNNLQILTRLMNRSKSNKHHAKEFEI